MKHSTISDIPDNILWNILKESAVSVKELTTVSSNFRRTVESHCVFRSSSVFERDSKEDFEIAANSHRKFENLSIYISSESNKEKMEAIRTVIWKNSTNLKSVDIEFAYGKLYSAEFIQNTFLLFRNVEEISIRCAANWNLLHQPPIKINDPITFSRAKKLKIEGFPIHDFSFIQFPCVEEFQFKIFEFYNHQNEILRFRDFMKFVKRSARLGSVSFEVDPYCYMRYLKGTELVLEMKHHYQFNIMKDFIKRKISRTKFVDIKYDDRFFV